VVELTPSVRLRNGKRAITGDTALRLGHWFGTSPQFWMNLQALYDVRVAEQEAGTEIKRLPTRPATPKTDQPGPRSRPTKSSGAAFLLWMSCSRKVPSMSPRTTGRPML